MIPKAPFGKTGHQSSRTLFGAAALGRVTDAEADRALEPRRHRESLERFPFDSVLFPYNPVQLRDPAYAADVEALIALCIDRGVAIQTIKSITLRPWSEARPPRPTTWYEPLTEQSDI